MRLKLQLIFPHTAGKTEDSREVTGPTIGRYANLARQKNKRLEEIKGGKGSACGNEME